MTLNKLKTAVRYIIPHKEWFIVWGGLLVKFKPRKQRKWVWLGNPFDITFDGCGPFTPDKIDSALREFTGE